MFRFRPPQRLALARMKQTALLGAGFATFAVGILVVPLPGPFGLPFMVVGSVLILRHSRRSRRVFVRLRRRYPQMLHPLNRFLRRRRRAPVAPLS